MLSGIKRSRPRGSFAIRTSHESSRAAKAAWLAVRMNEEPSGIAISGRMRRSGRVTRQDKNLVSVRTPPIHGVDSVAAVAGITASRNITTVLRQLSGVV